MILYSGTKFEIRFRRFDYVAWENECPTVLCDVNIEDRYDTHRLEGHMLSKDAIESIVEHIDRTLNDEFTEKTDLKFNEYYPLRFEIYGNDDHESDYWNLICETTGGWKNSGKSSFSIGLNRDDLAGIREMIVEEMEKTDWDSCGKTNVMKIQFPDIPYKECYSAKELEAEMSKLCNNQKLLGVMVSAENFMYMNRNAESSYRRFDMGGGVTVTFENFVVDFIIHAEGLFKYRTIPLTDVKYFGSVYEKIPFDNADCYCEIDKRYFEKEFTEETVVSCETRATESAPFNNPDKSLLSDPPELPERVIFNLSNGNSLQLIGDDNEYFAVYVG